MNLQWAAVERSRSFFAFTGPHPASASSPRWRQRTRNMTTTLRRFRPSSARWQSAGGEASAGRGRGRSVMRSAKRRRAFRLGRNSHCPISPTTANGAAAQEQNRHGWCRVREFRVSTGAENAYPPQQSGACRGAPGSSVRITSNPGPAPTFMRAAPGARAFVPGRNPCRFQRRTGVPCRSPQVLLSS